MSYSPVEQIKDPAVERELRRVGDAMLKPVLYVYHVAPEKPVDGMIVICDGDDWNPIGDGLKRPVWYDFVAGTWKTFA